MALSKIARPNIYFRDVENAQAFSLFVYLSRNVLTLATK